MLSNCYILVESLWKAAWYSLEEVGDFNNNEERGWDGVQGV